MYFRALIFSLLLVLGFTSSTRSEEVLTNINSVLNMSLAELQTIKVSSATRHEQPLTDIPATIYIFTEQDFIRYGFRDLKDILKYTSGVEYAYAHSWLQGGQRGFTGTWSHTRILIDGRDADKVIRNHAHITHQYPLYNIKRVEVIQGPASSLYGADVFAGLINLVTKTNKNSPEGQNYSITLGSGGDNMASTQVSYSTIYQTSSWGLSFHGSILDLTDPDYTDFVLSEQYSEINTELRQSFFDSGSAYQDENTGYNIAVLWNYQLKTGELEVGFDQRGSRDGGGIENPELIYTNFKETLDQTRLIVSHTIDQFAEGQLSLDYQFLREDMVYDFNLRNFDNGNPPPLVRFAQNDSDLQSFSVQYDKSFEEANNYFIVGIHYKDLVEATPIFDLGNFESRAPFYSHRLSSIYMQDQQALFDNRLLLTLGLRHDESNLYDNVNTMRGGIQYNFDAKYSIKLLYGQGYREPTSSELNKNDELNPADIETTELVFDGRPSEYISYKLSLYTSRAQNIIGENRLDTDGPIINIDSKNVDGMEFSLRWKQGENSGFFWANYTDNDVQLDLASYKLGFGVSRDLGENWMLNLIGKHTDEVDTEALNDNFIPNTVTIPKYTVVDLNLVGRDLFAWQGGNIQFSAAIHNIFDRRNFYSNSRGGDPIMFLAEGRNFFVNVSLSF